jgi:hypothetical protein
MTARPWLFLAALPLFGCSSTGQATFEDMKKSACEGDVQGFFAHVDKTQIGANLGKAKGQEGPTAIQATFTAWEDDIKKGRDGGLCKMQLTSAEERDGSSTVKWKSAAGKDNVWVFRRYDKSFLLVEMHGDEAQQAKTAAETPSAAASAAEAIPDRRGECSALIRVMNAEGAKLSTKGGANDPAAIARLAEGLDAAATATAAVKLTIPELIRYRDISSKIFVSTAGIARATSKALREGDGKSVNEGLKAMGDSADLNAKAVRAINKFCQSQP